VIKSVSTNWLWYWKISVVRLTDIFQYQSQFIDTDFIMCLMSDWLIFFSIRVSLLILILSLVLYYVFDVRLTDIFQYQSLFYFLCVDQKYKLADTTGHCLSMGIWRIFFFSQKVQTGWNPGEPLVDTCNNSSVEFVDTDFITRSLLCVWCQTDWYFSVSESVCWYWFYHSLRSNGKWKNYIRK
jgi:hypothetical protein